jgi:endoribonuclease Dicer
MKSYIQIKGRARKKNSKYIIFTLEKNQKKMEENKLIYDNTISAIYELAINHISKEDIDALEKVKYSASYEKVQTKGGALLNTNYALELLKSYFTSLKHPNKPYFHFVETSNICFKCIIKFPESSTCSKSYVIGKPQPRKDEALKSAAFVAVKILKKEGFIRDDLRPSRLEELEDELELEKYDDLGIYGKDAAYREIFDRYVQIEEGTDQHTHKKLIRFYFQSLEPERV